MAFIPETSKNSEVLCTLYSVRLSPRGETVNGDVGPDKGNEPTELEDPWYKCLLSTEYIETKNKTLLLP